MTVVTAGTGQGPRMNFSWSSALPYPGTLAREAGLLAVLAERHKVAPGPFKFLLRVLWGPDDLATRSVGREGRGRGRSVIAGVRVVVCAVSNMFVLGICF